MVDLAAGACTGTAALLVLPGRPRDALLVALAAAAGAVWRRSVVAAALAAVSLPAGVWTGVSPDSSWELVPVLTAAAALGLGASLPAAVLWVITLSVLVVVTEHLGPLDLVFVAVVLGGSATACRLVRAAGARSQRADARATALASEPPELVAHRAVVVERARLAGDVQTVVRLAVTTMARCAESAAGAEDPSQHLVAIRADGERAIGELRRLLGLLRGAASHRTTTTGSGEEPPTAAPPGVGPVHRLSRRWTEGMIAAAAVGTALVERWAYRSDLLPGQQSTTALVLTVVAAATVVLRRRASGVGAAACGLALLTGALLGRPVALGFWYLVVAGALAWAAAVRRRWAPSLGVVVLALGASTAWGLSPADGFFALLPVGVAFAAGHLVAARDAVSDTAAARSQVLAAERARASEEAVRAERLSVARELHDVVSHSIGLMVVQASAAEALWSTDRAAAGRALDVVRASAADALRELDQLLEVISTGVLGAAAPASSGCYDVADLHALVARMRAGGLAVDVAVHPDEGVVDAAAYRVVQESLTNALRYATCARVHVVVERTASATRVCVTDDGRGAPAGSRSGYGLIGLTERVERVGGTLTAGRGPGTSGFAVRAEIPLLQGSPT